MKKYEKVFPKDYETWYEENEIYRKQVAADPDRLKIHLMPETGWMNDPNGLCQFKGEYHIYYQYTPFEPTGELKLWGHYKTRDFISYEQCQPVLFPDSDEDAHGVYSGSAFCEGGKIHFFYTGNVKLFDRPDYDYINSGRVSNTMYVTSEDGMHFSEKKRLMTNSDYPADISAHVRDPKIIKREDGYYMVLGARDKDSKGLVLVYRSDDLINWNYHGRITTENAFGYMWECPDLFELDGQLCLICCPQGVEKQGYDYWNVHQCVFIPLDYDFRPGTYVLKSMDCIQMVDRGFDFYAPQTFEDQQGRRILIGWMGIPDADYTNPTAEKGWQHALTIPRQLHVRDGKLYQEPLKELEALCCCKQTFVKGKWDQTAEAKLPECAKVQVDFENCKNLELCIGDSIKLVYKDTILTLDMGDCGSGRTVRKAVLDQLRNITLFADTTSLEFFINEGSQVFTTRVYGRKDKAVFTGNCKAQIQIWKMNGFEMKRG